MAKAEWVLDPETGTFSKKVTSRTMGVPPSRLPEYRRRFHQEKYRSNPEYRAQVQFRERERRRLRLVHEIPVEGTACEICGTTDNGVSITGSRRALVLDHNHSTGQFRGWLCNRCNAGIGMFGDDVEKLESAIRYLRAEKDAK